MPAGKRVSSAPKAPSKSKAKYQGKRTKYQGRRAQPKKRSKAPFVFSLSMVAAILVGYLVFFGRSEEPLKISPTVPAARTAILGDTDDDLCADFDEAGIVCVVEWKISTRAKGELLSQDPASGEKSETVTLVYSDGPATVSPPLLSGLELEQAEEILWASGLEPGLVTEENSSTPTGTIIASSLEGKDEVTNGTPVDLTVSNGNISVPDWTGKTREAVDYQSSSRGIKVIFVEKKSNKPIGVVIDQSAMGNVKYSTQVRVVLSAASTENAKAELPDVVGMTEKDAISLLASDGFLKITIKKNGEKNSPGAVVSRMKPGAGKSVPLTKEIVLVISSEKSR